MLSAKQRACAVLVPFTYWLCLYAALWVMLSGGAGWVFGALSVLLAACLSLSLGVHPPKIRMTRLPAFTLFFLRAALHGALAVARRALRRTRGFTPSWVDYPLRVTEPRARLLISAMVGLLPGTLSSEIHEDLLRVHILDESAEWQTTVARLEQQVAKLLSAESATGPRSWN